MNEDLKSEFKKLQGKIEEKFGGKITRFFADFDSNGKLERAYYCHKIGKTQLNVFVGSDED